MTDATMRQRLLAAFRRTGADVPGELKTGLIHQDWPCFIPVGGRTSHRGDVLALLAQIAGGARERPWVVLSEEHLAGRQTTLAKS